MNETLAKHVKAQEWIRDFLTAIKDGTQPSPSFEEGLNVQYVLDAVEESAANKSTLTVVRH